MWAQNSLFDAELDSESDAGFGTGAAGALADFSDAERLHLGRGAWLDVRPGWLGGAGDLYAHLVDAVPWRAESREMYDRTVAVPRLTCSFGAKDQLPAPILDDARRALSNHYADELGEPFVTAGLCYYRDGRDSVAWHGDRIGRGRSENTMVAIISLGARRRLCLRPRGGGEQVAMPMGPGDLIVMGGTCQRTWDHAIPKTAKAVGPRISVQFRPLNVL